MLRFSIPPVAPLMFRKKAPTEAIFEALEALLVEKRVLKDGELSEKLENVLQKHYERGEFIPNEVD